MDVQLRIYKVKESKLDSFVSAWRREVLPLRRSFGFEVMGAWYNVDRSEFVWQLAYAGSRSLQEREAQYAATRATVEFEEDPAQYLDDVKIRYLTSVDLDAASCEA